jgi:hypothetical protein
MCTVTRDNDVQVYNWKRALLASPVRIDRSIGAYQLAMVQVERLRVSHPCHVQSDRGTHSETSSTDRANGASPEFLKCALSTASIDWTYGATSATDRLRDDAYYIPLQAAMHHSRQCLMNPRIKFVVTYTVQVEP